MLLLLVALSVGLTVCDSAELLHSPYVNDACRRDVLQDGFELSTKGIALVLGHKLLKENPFMVHFVSKEHKQALYSIHIIGKDPNRFFPDLARPHDWYSHHEAISLEDWEGIFSTQWSRGHMVPSADHNHSPSLFYMHNIVLQDRSMNSKQWSSLEESMRLTSTNHPGCRDFNNVVITGILVDEPPSKTDIHHEGRQLQHTIPSHLFKILYCPQSDAAWFHVMENNQGAATVDMTYDELNQRLSISLDKLYPKLRSAEFKAATLQYIAPSWEEVLHVSRLAGWADAATYGYQRSAAKVENKMQEFSQVTSLDAVFGIRVFNIMLEAIGLILQKRLPPVHQDSTLSLVVRGASTAHQSFSSTPFSLIIPDSTTEGGDSDTHEFSLFDDVDDANPIGDLKFIKQSMIPKSMFHSGLGIFAIQGKHLFMTYLEQRLARQYKFQTVSTPYEEGDQKRRLLTIDQAATEIQNSVKHMLQEHGIIESSHIDAASVAAEAGRRRDPGKAEDSQPGCTLTRIVHECIQAEQEWILHILKPNRELDRDVNDHIKRDVQNLVNALNLDRLSHLDVLCDPSK